MSIFLADEAATLAHGQSLAEQFQNGGIVLLNGTLGAGKTTLCKGILSGLGHVGNVKSPTYTLVETYDCSGLAVYHFDLYRLSDPEEMEFLGAREYLSSNNLCLIEWPERGLGWLPSANWRIDIQPHRGPHQHNDSQQHSGRMLTFEQLTQ